MPLVEASVMELVREPERVRLALSPLRRQLLEHLGRPMSATQLADLLGLARQKVNYHLRLLEGAGMVELVEERQRRGCVERVLRATSKAFVVDPGMLATDTPATEQDQFAAEHLVGVASGVVRDVARMQAGAERTGRRLLTFTIETEIRFAEPADVERFTTAVAGAVARTAHRFNRETGQPYRIVVGGHPAPATDPEEQP
jgi:DNA-binding transcriptional ArsR family regulator